MHPLNPPNIYWRRLACNHVITSSFKKGRNGWEAVRIDVLMNRNIKPRPTALQFNPLLIGSLLGGFDVEVPPRLQI